MHLRIFSVKNVELSTSEIVSNITRLWTFLAVCWQKNVTQKFSDASNYFLSLLIPAQTKLCHDLTMFLTDGVCSDFILIW